MKTDLATSIVAAIIGVIVAYFVCGIFLPEISSVSFDILETEGEPDYTLVDPNPEVFNYRAVDPTVEVYVGQDNPEEDNTTILPETPADTPTDTPTEEENGPTEMPDIPEDTPVEEDDENGTTD